MAAGCHDILILFVVDLLLVFYRSREELSLNGILLHGGIQCYIRFLIVDAIAFAATLAIELTLPLFVHIEKVTFSRLLSIASMNLLGALAIRMIYRYCFKCGTADTGFGKFLRLLRTFAGEELLANAASAYTPPVLHRRKHREGGPLHPRHSGDDGRRNHRGGAAKPRGAGGGRLQR